MCQRLIQAEKNVGHSFFPPSYIPQRFCKNKQYPYVEEVLEYVKRTYPLICSSRKVDMPA